MRKSFVGTDSRRNSNTPYKNRMINKTPVSDEKRLLKSFSEGFNFPGDYYIHTKNK